MRKISKFMFVICMLVLLFYFGILVADKQTLRTKIIRLHVVGNSNCADDQTEKLAVRDAVLGRLEECLDGVDNVSDAKEVIRINLSSINEVANTALSKLCSEHYATTTLAPEKFERREYKTFSLPTGVYESLKVQIGTGQGKNWWCVVFPALCIPFTTEMFQSTAVSRGFNPGLATTLSNEPTYEFRFLLLDYLGKIENFLFFL